MSVASTRRTTATTATTATTVTAALAAIALVAVQLFGIAHDASTRHVRCAAHGELIEAPAVREHGGQASQFVGLDNDGGDDVHCAIAAGVAPHNATARPPTLASPTGVVAARVAESATASRARTDLYRLAPKTSPPSARWSI